ncbi:MAG: arginine deiminase family protein [Thermomicrobiales bacterium]
MSRMASASRAGEERWAAAALAREGVPIVHSVDHDGTFEGADVVVANEDLVFVGLGMRSNRSGVQQVARAFRDAGVAEVIEVEIPPWLRAYRRHHQRGGQRPGDGHADPALLGGLSENLQKNGTASR